MVELTTGRLPVSVAVLSRLRCPSACGRFAVEYSRRSLVPGGFKGYVGCRTILVWSTARLSECTLLYPPVFNLRSVTVDGALDSQLTFGDGSYVEPDSHSSGRLVAMLVKTQSDVWRFATEGILGRTLGRYANHGTDGPGAGAVGES